MKNYLYLSVRYLKLKKKRSIVTIIGVSVAVIVLYMMLNLCWSWLLDARENARKDNDYEIVFFTDDTENLQQLMKDDRVK